MQVGLLDRTAAIIFANMVFCRASLRITELSRQSSKILDYAHFLF